MLPLTRCMCEAAFTCAMSRECVDPKSLLTEPLIRRREMLLRLVLCSREGEDANTSTAAGFRDSALS